MKVTEKINCANVAPAAWAEWSAWTTETGNIGACKPCEMLKRKRDCIEDDTKKPVDENRCIGCKAHQEKMCPLGCHSKFYFFVINKRSLNANISIIS